MGLTQKEHDDLQASVATAKASVASTAKTLDSLQVQISGLLVSTPVQPPVTVPPVVPPITPPVQPPVSGEVLATLPQKQVDITMPVQTGHVLNVPAGGNLQAALDAAVPGDTIALANGATWKGTYRLRNKGTAAAGWIIVRPADMSKIPAAGTRMNPALAAGASLPCIETTSNAGALETDPGAHHYRFIGVEIRNTPAIHNGGLLRMGSGYETTITDLPHHLVFDRMYVHGAPTGNTRRAYVLNCGEAAVIDSYVEDIHEQGSDSQAIASWSGSGPFLIEGNYLSAASENIMFGGGDPSIAGLVAADITIRRNHITKQDAWKGKGWVIKNLFELKAALRVLVEGNVLDGCWSDGQGGSAANIKSVNQDGTCPACGTEDVTFRYNVVCNVGSGFMLTGLDVGASRIMSRVTIVHNLTFNIDVAPQYTGDTRGYLINENPADLLIAHNTTLDQKNTAITFGGPTQHPPTNLRIRDNIMDSGAYGVKGTGMGTPQAIKSFVKLYDHNLHIGGGPVTEYPAGNAVAPSRQAVGFNPDFSLSASSPYKGKASDGTDPGADIPVLLRMTAGVDQT